MNEHLAHPVQESILVVDDQPDRKVRIEDPMPGMVMVEYAE